MRKTLLIIIALVFLLSAFSFGEVRKGAALGLEGISGWTSGYGGLGGTALTFKLPKLPIMWAVDLDFWWGFHVGLTADWWILNNQVGGPFYWYWGVGLFGGIWTAPGFFDVTVGGRVPVGLQFWLFEITEIPNNLELFIEAAPGLGARIGSSTGLQFSIPVAVGFRWWF